jgi:hypothetical protein
VWLDIIISALCSMSKCMWDVGCNFIKNKYFFFFEEMIFVVKLFNDWMMAMMVLRKSF